MQCTDDMTQIDKQIDRQIDRQTETDDIVHREEILDVVTLFSLVLRSASTVLRKKVPFHLPLLLEHLDQGQEKYPQSRQAQQHLQQMALLILPLDPL